MIHFKRIVRIAVGIPLLSLAGFALLLFFRQHSMIYHPRHYGPKDAISIPQHGQELDFRTSQGEQEAFYIPPKNSALGVPKRIWVMFGGNASLALDWRGFLATAPNPDDGFLLVDYPGYGACEGSASPETIGESADRALEETGRKLGLDRETLNRKLNVIGHSLGCGIALNFCAEHAVGKVILIAPFTSLRDMAGRTVGFPLCYLLRHNFDNRARLAGLAGLQHPPAVFLFHGTNDEVIPVAMGRELASLFPSMITYREIAGTGHNTILLDAQSKIYEVMER